MFYYRLCQYSIAALFFLLQYLQYSAAPGVVCQSHVRAAQASHASNYSVLNPDSSFSRPVSPLITVPSLPVIKQSHSGGCLPGGGGREVAAILFPFHSRLSSPLPDWPLLIRPNFNSQESPANSRF